jgi:thiol:disulfide interchange protein DsbA
MIRTLIAAAVVILCVSGCERHALFAANTAATTKHDDGLPPGTKWQKGVHYDLVAPAQPAPASGGKVQVVEFFWYGCPHCYTLEPHLVLWNKMNPDHVQFVRVPAAWHESSRTLARLFYTLQALGREDLHQEAFDTIHRRDNPLESLDNDAAQTLKLQSEFAQSHGIDPQAFVAAYNSPGVAAAIREAEQLALRYQVTGVPTIVVNGKYRTSLRQVGGCERDLTALLDEIVKQEHGG